MALEDALQELDGQDSTVGWPQDEIADALFAPAINYPLAAIENENADAASRPGAKRNRERKD